MGEGWIVRRGGLDVFDPVAEAVVVGKVLIDEVILLVRGQIEEGFEVLLFLEGVRRRDGSGTGLSCLRAAEAGTVKAAMLLVAGADDG